MDLGCWRFSGHPLFCFLLVWLLHGACRAQICSAPGRVNVRENEPAGTLVVRITTTLEGVAFQLQSDPENLFRLQGADVVVNTPLDYETLPADITIIIDCTHPQDSPHQVQLLVLVDNVNDVKPVFADSQYNLTIAELSPVDTSVGKVEATDEEGDVLYYRMVPENEYFKMETLNSPIIVVKAPVDYDRVQSISFNVTAVDTPTPPPPNVDSFTAMTTVTINIEDEDNRPPWFQPCSKQTIGSTTICLSPGYTGRVNLTEKTEGVLELEPGPLQAIDGDWGRNDSIIYRIISGNEAGIFQLDENSGGISMLKAADVAGPIVLTVLALQLVNSDQFSSTTVTFRVVERSEHPPQFLQPLYQGFLPGDSGPSSLVLEDGSMNRPLRVQATDADYLEGLNVHVRYSVEEGSSFTVTDEGFVLLTGGVAPGTVSMQILAVDTTNGESGSATLSVQVLPGATTAMPTTERPTTERPTTERPTTEMATTDMATTEMATTERPTTEMATAGVATITASTPQPISGVPMTTPSLEDTDHTEGGVKPPPVPGQYGGADMAALGASLAVLLLLCVGIIVLLLFRLKKGDAAWKKISEASLFQSTLARGSGGMKEGVQYTNSGFQHDGDSGSVTSDLPSKVALSPDGGGGDPARDAAERNQAALALALTGRYENLLSDGSSLAGSDRADSEKEVRPILTKERRNEEGYKSVWFKEDIQPDAKEEVRIIPQSGERDADEEDEDEEGEEGEDSLDGEDGEDVSPPASPALQTLDTGGAAGDNDDGDNSDL